MSRTVKNCNAELIVVPPFESEDLQKWIEECCARDKYSWILAHLLGGVSWGRYQNAGLRMEKSAGNDGITGFPDTDSLSMENLLQLRLFSNDQELFVWKDSNNKLRGRIIKDNASDPAARWKSCIDEEHALWGTVSEKQKDGSILLRERGRDLQQIIPSMPMTEASQGTKRLQLKVRQYLEECPSTGKLSVRCGRLLELVGG
ncbi:MAG: TIGR03984 family CRISPR-associated protein [Candidatus Obscuribacterales bacterium]|nr:TIGR03984 family CRISPR-associated protein [Candidatus Obscuribacterales bacterium]